MAIEFDQPTPTADSIALTQQHFDIILKANEKQAAQIDDLLKRDPKLSEDYKKFSESQVAKNADQVRQDTNDLVSMIFDSIYSPNTTIDDKGFKWIDNAIGRGVPYPYLRKAGKTEVPRMIKNLRRFQLTEFGELASRKEYGKEVGFCLEWIEPQYKPKAEEEKQRTFFEKEIHKNFF